LTSSVNRIDESRIIDRANFSILQNEVNRDSTRIKEVVETVDGISTDVNRLEEILNNVSTNWTSILTILSIITSLVSLGASQTRIYFSSPSKMYQKTKINSAFIFFVTMLQVLPKLLACQTMAFGLVGSKLKCPDGILVFLLFFPYFSSTWKTLMVALYLRLFHTLFFDKMKQLFLSPFVFTQIEKGATNYQEERRNKVFVTENGKCHLLFDFLSLLENVCLSTIGSIFIAEVEKTFDLKTFIGILIGTHVLGLLLKFTYYTYQHPWRKLSLAHYCLEKTSKTLILFLGISFIVGMPLIGHFCVESVTIRTILYTATGFCLFWVSLF
jgi:hypothetical protein